MLFISPSNIENSLFNLQQCLLFLRSWFLHIGLALNSDITEVTCLGTTHRRQSLSSLTSIQVADVSVSLLTISNYSVSHLIVAWALINTSQTSAQYPTFTNGLSVISGLSWILRVANPLPVPLSVRGLTMLIHAYQASPPTIFTDCCQTHRLYYYVAFTTCLSSLAAYPSASHFQACQPSLP